MKIYVYVLNKWGNPLMPTSPAKARRLLKSEKATVVTRKPFTIRLIYGSTGYKQRVILGVDTGYETVGLSAVSGGKELFSSEVKLRTDIPKKLSEKRMYRRGRRNKLWYRKPRFSNRTSSKKKGWLSPSIKHRLDEHIKAVNLVSSILPIKEINVEAAAFDIQKIKNPDISGTDYQNGEQAGFWNVREYVLHRDGHKCQHCGGKSKDKVLNVHHIISRADGGTDKPCNLITLCEKCHDSYHKGKIKLEIKKHKQFKAETIMSILRWKIVNRLREFGNVVSVTYGYLTKSARIDLGLEKSHANDAFVIAGGSMQERANVANGLYTRRNNRCLQLNRKGFQPSIRKRRYPFQPNDLVRYGKSVLKVVGMFNHGTWVRLQDKFKNKMNVNAKKVELLVYGKGLRFT